MPAFWRRISVDICHVFSAAVDNLYANKHEESHDSVWSKSNVWALICFFRLESFIKARAYYLAVKRDQLVLYTIN